MAIQEVERSYLRKLDVDEVVRHVRGAVNDHHGLQVARVVLLKPGSVLRTSSGKIRRIACREAFLEKKFQEIT